jgi:hypothetical protein
LTDLPSATADFDLELRRVVDRLRGMPMNRLPAVRDAVWEACNTLLEITARLGDPAPVELPDLRPTALGDQLAVIATDLRSAALHQHDVSALAEAADLLTQVRRAC